jgi:hypothetical protein
VQGLNAAPGRGRLRAWFPIAVALLALGFPARGDDTEAPSSEPFSLAADRVRVWDEGPRHFVLLEGRAALLQGMEGTRADRAVVRIEVVSVDHEPREEVAIYAEGNVRSAAGHGPVRPSVRLQRLTRPAVRVTVLGSGQADRLKQPPTGIPLLARAFPKEPPNLQATPPLVQAGPVLGGPNASPLTNDLGEDPDRAPPTQGRSPTPAPALNKRGSGGTRTATAPAQTVDPAVRRAQFDDPFPEPAFPQVPAPTEPVQDNAPVMPAPDPAFDTQGEAEIIPAPEAVPLEGGEILPDQTPAPILPGMRRFTYISPRDSGSNFTFMRRKEGDWTIYVVRGGVNVLSEVPGKGMVDISADSAVIWSRDNPADPDDKGLQNGPGAMVKDAQAPMEIYLEGNVVFMQDKRQLAGNADQKRVEAPRFYYDFRKESFLAPDADMAFFTPGLLSPTHAIGKRVQQYKPLLGYDAKGRPLFGPNKIRVDKSLLTGSRFPEPGYKFTSTVTDLTQVLETQTDPVTGIPVADPRSPTAPKENVYHIDARQNTYFIGWFPVFFWPKVEMDSDDLDPTIRNLQFHYNNYLGYQFLTDWNMFKILDWRKPRWIDTWNLDLDYMSRRGFAAGTEIGWFGNNLLGDLSDPYRKSKTKWDPNLPYFGYFDAYILDDHAPGDDLGPGPAIVTAGPPDAGKRGYQRTDVPYFTDPRGRLVFRHMQDFLPPDAPLDTDLRLQLEVGYLSDRYFLEEFYKRLFDTGMDQETLAYGIYQNQNRAATVLAEANLQDWYTESQWAPKLDYYRLGDNFFGLFNYFQNTGGDWANTHTAVEVNNPRIFAFLPYDPVSNTRGVFETGRLYTSHELDMPLSFGFIRVVPYVQGQLVGWNNQIGGESLGRAWGAFGGRANVMLWKNFPGVESELLNVHGLSHKINFDVDYRSAYSNVGLRRIGIQDDLDTNNYEYVRRYFALTNYIGGILPLQYDPRYLTLRRAISPITGTTDVQGTVETVQMAIRQRLQTKRGPEGKRRIIDWMTLDLSTTYFPNGNRDNFGKAFGQNQYNWEWFIGDRTSIISYGWFEFWKVTGDPTSVSVAQHSNNPFGLNVITSGISINRPPRGSVFFGYTVINTGVINTSALNVAFTYWMSPKWYGTFGTSYDFGNAVLLGSTFAVTKIGADFLTSAGLTVDPQRQSFQFGFELSPRLSPSVRIGSGGGVARFDQRFAPTQ